MMAFYHTAILVLLGILALILSVNLLTFRRVKSGTRPSASPFVSILVPARNEASRIEECLRSLAAQDYPNYEIIVLDDRSEDDTWEILQRWERTHPRVRALRGSPLPNDWVGKCFACHQLSLYAHGELLLFTDADTVHAPTALSSAVATLHDSNAELLTLLPQLTMRSFWERTIMPLLHFVTFTVLPFPFVHHFRNWRFAMANGQFMLFRRSVYEAISGHEAVQSALVEDVWLARRVKKFGYRLRVADGSEIVSTRMYSSLAEIWNGFSKNLFPGFGFSLWAISPVLLFLLATSVAPFGFLVSSVLSPAPPDWQGLVIAQVVLIMTMRLALARAFSHRYASSFLHPMAMLVVIGIALNSVRSALWANGLRWKGRVYQWNHTRQNLTLVYSSDKTQ